MHPSSAIQAISSIVNPSIRRIENPIRLEEADPGSTCRPVTINKSGLAVVLKVDDALEECPRSDCPISLPNNARMFPLLNHREAGVTAICDYIIFYQSTKGDTVAAGPLYVLLCELKSGRPGESKQQIENGRMVADYIIRMAEHHGRISMPDRVSYKGIVFSPRYPGPKGDPKRNPCQFSEASERMPDVGFSYQRDGLSYTLEYFCT